MRSSSSIVVAAGSFAFLLCQSQAGNTELVSSQSGPIMVETLAKLDNPWAITSLPDGRLLITEKPGRLRIFANGQLSKPVTGLPNLDYRAEGGLLDVKIDPQF